MGKSKRGPDPPSLQKYGVPLYSAAWIPYKHVRSKLNRDADDDEYYYVVLAGGGGEGRSGIPNAILLSRFDLASSSLSPQPVAKLGLGSDLPYRMAVHPNGEGVICALSTSCRFYEWDQIKEDEEPKLGVKVSEKALSQLEDVGQQLALAFNSDGSVFATGDEDGCLRVFKWPSMDNILEESQAHASVKDLCFSHEGKFLVSLGGRGPGRVWDLSNATALASLKKENDEVFAACRFSQISDEMDILYTATITGKYGSIVTWNTSTWQRMKSTHVVRVPVSSFNVSPNGKFLAVGTVQGDVVLINATNMRVLSTVSGAHLGIVTALAFSHNSRALVSASMDSSTKVILIDDKIEQKGGSNLWIIIFMVLIAIAAYFMKIHGLLPLRD